MLFSPKTTRNPPQRSPKNETKAESLEFPQVLKRIGFSKTDRSFNQPSGKERELHKTGCDRFFSNTVFHVHVHNVRDNWFALSRVVGDIFLEILTKRRTRAINRPFRNRSRRAHRSINRWFSTKNQLNRAESRDKWPPECWFCPFATQPGRWITITFPLARGLASLDRFVQMITRYLSDRPVISNGEINWSSLTRRSRKQVDSLRVAGLLISLEFYWEWFCNHRESATDCEIDFKWISRQREITNICVFVLLRFGFVAVN